MFSIKLLEHTGSDMSCANYARQSFTNPKNIHDIPEGYTEKSALGIVNFCGRNGHSTPFRHPTVTISMSIPMFLARQIGKHQTGFSWSEKSMRYTTAPKYWVPDQWRSKAANVKQGSSNEPVGHMVCPITGKATVSVQTAYGNTLRLLQDVYEGMLEADVAPEMARMVLPQSMMVDVVWTGSLLGFAFMCKQRLDDHAQLEAQWFAKEVQELLAPLYPNAWAALMADSPEKQKLTKLKHILINFADDEGTTDGEVLDSIYDLLED